MSERPLGCRLLLAVVAATLGAGWARAGEVPLVVDWAGQTLDRPLPVTGGVPIARGELTDPKAVRLIVDGQAAPLQTEVLAVWPDKSVKWLLLDFQVRPSAKRLVLQYGAGVAPAGGPKDAIAAEATDSAVTVDTGQVRFVIRRDGGGFLDELSFAGRPLPNAAGRRLNLMDAIHADNPADCPPTGRTVVNGRADPSRVVVTSVKLERPGPLHAVVLVEGRYTYRHVGTTIRGTDVKGDCPFRLRVHAYAGWSLLGVEHFFIYEGDGDHDFVQALALKVPLPAGAAKVRFLPDGGEPIAIDAPLAGLHQPTADAWELWTSDGAAPKVRRTGERFEGVLDAAGGEVGVAVGVRDFWQNHAKALHADTKAGELGIYLWPPESPPLDFRRHAREWSVGETGEPDDKDADTPAPFADHRSNYRLASKGVGKTHYAMVYLHRPDAPDAELIGAWRHFNRRPLLWAPPAHYAASLALGRYRPHVPGEHEDIERALDLPMQYWRHSQEHFRWYGLWLYGNVCQSINNFLPIGRWEQSFGRWGWANGDSVGRLSYALMLQAVRKARREDLTFAEKYLYNVHDVCSTHTPAYPEHFGANFAYFKGTAHRHGAWPWACPYTGIRGAHPVGAKIYYFLTGEGHARDILEEITQLALKRPDGGMGDGPLGPNAQIFLFQWEATGDDVWRQRLHKEIVSSDLAKATGGWLVMMNAAFGIYNALEEYMELTGDRSLAGQARRFADEAVPEKMKRHWTWAGYYRVYAAAYNITGDAKYRKAIEEMLPRFLEEVDASVAAKLAPGDWPGPAFGPRFFADGNAIRDLPFALYALHNAPAAKEGK